MRPADFDSFMKAFVVPINQLPDSDRITLVENRANWSRASHRSTILRRQLFLWSVLGVLGASASLALLIFASVELLPILFGAG
jgi:hypothetical protein